MQENATLSNKKTEEILETIFTYLNKQVKKSLQFSDFALQETLVETFNKISLVKHENIPLPIMKLLLYIIMIPTSKYSWLAVNIFIELSKTDGVSNATLYQKYKRELCKEIVELCAINQALINNPLSISLERVSLVLGYFGVKNFVTQDSHYLLPYLVPLVVNMPKVSYLIEEVSTLVELDLSDLLASRYGNIFLQLFLYETDVIFNASMKYLETSTDLSGPALRKRNFKVSRNSVLITCFHFPLLFITYISRACILL